jgi:S-DNA-T family DNA segregation ATPase FtsK/SpoIIIE
MKIKNPIVQKVYNVLQQTGFEKTVILDVEQDENKLLVKVILPANKDLDDLDGILQNLKQEVNGLDVKFGKIKGKKVEMLFGMKDLSKVTYNIRENTLQIELPSSYGISILDFEDGASCHLLNGGTTRMGKTNFLLYVCTLLYLQNNGDIDFYITSTKLKDYYPFFGLPNVKTAKEIEQFDLLLDDIINLYEHRDSLLYSPEFIKATDAKDIKKFYPDKYDLFRPVFVVIDEYARYADSPHIQKKVMKLVETAGFVNIHVLISSQRPDARTVLPPRIKGNLLARVCFTTTDKNNSIVILDQEGAERLGRIPGRAIFLNSDLNIVQVPRMKAIDSVKLLKPFKRGVKQNVNENKKGSNDNSLSESFQGLHAQSVSIIGIQEEHQPGERVQSSDEKTINGWFRLANTQDER